MSRSVVVTGAGTGIGRAIFDRLLADGWNVVGLDLHPDRAARASAAAGDRGDVVVGDVAEQSALEEAADRAQAFAPLMGWVNNAGLAISGNLHDPKPDEVDRLFRVNLMGVFWGSSVAVRRFLAQRLRRLVGSDGFSGQGWRRGLGGLRLRLLRLGSLDLRLLRLVGS